MKRSLTCPKCQHRKLWVVPEVDLARNLLVPMELGAMEMEMLGVREGQVLTARKEDSIHGFETYVCAACGYSETYATSLEYCAKVGTLVDGEAGPYR